MGGTHNGVHYVTARLISLKDIHYTVSRRGGQYPHGHFGRPPYVSLLHHETCRSPSPTERRSSGKQRKRRGDILSDRCAVFIASGRDAIDVPYGTVRLISLNAITILHPVGASTGRPPNVTSHFATGRAGARPLRNGAHPVWQPQKGGGYII